MLVSRIENGFIIFKNEKMLFILTLNLLELEGRILEGASSSNETLVYQTDELDSILFDIASLPNGNYQNDPKAFCSSKTEVNEYLSSLLDECCVLNFPDLDCVKWMQGKLSDRCWPATCILSKWSGTGGKSIFWGYSKT